MTHRIAFPGVELIYETDPEGLRSIRPEWAEPSGRGERTSALFFAVAGIPEFREAIEPMDSFEAYRFIGRTIDTIPGDCGADLDLLSLMLFEAKAMSDLGRSEA